jgi:protein O-mannosyl-transferase
MAKAKSKRKANAKKVTAKPQKSREWLWFVLVIVIVFVAHFPSLLNGFTNWDDPAYVTKNEFIKGISLDNLKAIFGEYHNGHYHPLTWISLAFNYSLFELKPFGYHLFNLLYHIINVCLVYLVIKALLKKWQIALITALFFGISPLSVESVSWITEQKNLLYTIFFLSSLFAYIKYLENEKTKLYLISVSLFILSVLSKSMAVTLPIVLVLVDYLKERKLISKKVILEKVPFFLFSIIFGIVSILAQEKTVSELQYVIPLDAKLAYGAWGFSKYFFFTVLPFQLSAFYPYVLHDFPVYYFLGWLFILIYLCFIWIMYKKNSRLVVFGLLFFLVNIFLLLKFFNIPYGSFYIADRYTYVSSIGLFLILSNYLNSNKKSIHRLSAISVGVIVALSVFYSTYTFKRSKIWNNSISLWNDVIDKYPGAHVPLVNRGNAFRDEKLYADAIQDYSKVITEDSAYFEAFVNRGYAFDLTGNFNEAISDYNVALKLKPNDKNTLYNRALCYQKMGKNEVAVIEIQESLKKGDINASSYNILGNASFSKNKFDDAIGYYSKAIEKDPKAAQYWYNRANSKAMIKKHEDAILDYNRAIELDNSNADYFFNRGTTKYFLKDNMAAKQDMITAIHLNPNNANFYLNLSTIEITLGNLNAAIKDLTLAINLDVKNAQNYARRAVVYFQSNKTGLGCKDANTALRLGYAPANELLKKYCK